MHKIFRLVLYILALIGLLFAGVFVAMQFNLLNVKGSASNRNSYFNIKNTFQKKNNNLSDLEIICRINTLSRYAPITAINIYKTLEQGASYETIDQMLYIASVRFETNNSYVRDVESCRTVNGGAINLPMSAYNWADSDEWNLMREVFTRDQEVINRAAHDAGISPRYLLGGVIGEQFRFFTNSRESFKRYFEPLKILASLSKFSFGIAGLKPDTVALIEEHLKNPNSTFYLGADMEYVVDYPDGVDIESERMTRITNAKDPYYAYLYVGLYMRQVQAQWKNAGYDISNRPEILATLYNLGFNRSIPKPNSAPGGAVITVNGKEYTFGDIAYEFYYSGELADIFPLSK